MNRSVAAEKRILALAKRTKRPAGPAEDEEAGAVRHPDHPKGVPDWVPRQHWDKWLRPWEQAAGRSAAFRELCWTHGHVSPNFARKEAACHDPKNTAVPNDLRTNAQRHGFNLERLRHALGDKPLPILSWYRTPAWNAKVGGVMNSRHLQADGNDFTVQTAASFRADKFDSACEKVYADGGFGRYASGSRHADSRGSRARW